MANLLFYLMGFGVVATAALVVAAKNPVMSVLALLGSFFCLATIYLLAGFQFMAAAQILVYAGAIMVLFLFVLMLLNVGGVSRERWLDADLLRRRHLPLILGIGGAVLLVVAVAASDHAGVLAAVGAPAAVPEGESIDSVTALAALLFGRFLLPFEAASMLLLATAVAVLVLAKRERGRTGAGREAGE